MSFYVLFSVERPICDCEYAIGRRACRSFHCVGPYSGSVRVNSFPFFFLFGATAHNGPGLPPPPTIHEVSTSLNDAPQSVGLLWTSDQFVAQQSQQIDIYALGGIRTHNLSRRAVAELRLIPRGHRD